MESYIGKEWTPEMQKAAAHLKILMEEASQVAKQFELQLTCAWESSHGGEYDLISYGVPEFAVTVMNELDRGLTSEYRLIALLNKLENSKG